MKKQLPEFTPGLVATPLATAEEQALFAAAVAAEMITGDDAGKPHSQGPAAQTTSRLEAFYRPVKQSTTIRIDADILHWLKGKGRGYQTRLNMILREAMLRERG
jgi:uncharacterized protein (DUF4415 family)